MVYIGGLFKIARMQDPLKVFFHNVPKTTGLYNIICVKAAHLEKVYARITDCRVAFEKPQKSKEPGGLYRVKIVILLPRRETLTVKKESKSSGAYAELSVLIRDAFEAAERKLEKIKEKEYMPAKAWRHIKIEEAQYV